MMRAFLRRYKLLIIALPLLFAPMWEYVRLTDGIRGYIADTGVVVDHAEVRYRITSPHWKPVVEYTGLNGEKRRFTSHVGQRPATPVGTRVDILVEPNHRQRAYLAGIRGYWFDFSIIAVLGFGFYACIAAITFFSEGRVKSERQPSMKRKIKKAGGGEIHLEDGTISSVPSTEALKRMLQKVGYPGNGFAVLKRSEQAYIQVSGTLSAGFIVEYRDGDAATHRLSSGRRLNQQEMINLLVSYFKKQHGWESALTWETLNV